MSSAVFAFALLFVGAISASPCTNLVPKADLDFSRINGQWFVVQGFVHGVEAKPIKCFKETVQANADGHIATQTEYIRIEGNEKVIRSGISIPIGGVQSRFSYTEPNSPDTTFECVLLATDYDHCALWVTCPAAAPEAYYITVSSKQTTLSSELIEEVKQTLRANNIPDTLRQLSHIGC